MVLKLSKRMPARTKTLVAQWIKKDFMVMSPEYRAICARVGRAMDTCHWCGHRFTDGEMMALVVLTRGGNKLLCQGCADEMEGGE